MFCLYFESKMVDRPINIFTTCILLGKLYFYIKETFEYGRKVNGFKFTSVESLMLIHVGNESKLYHFILLPSLQYEIEPDKLG